MPESQKPRKPMNPVPVYEREKPARKVVRLGGGTHVDLKRGLIIGGIAGAGAGAYLIHQRSKNKEKEKTVTASKNLVNPYEEVVVFGKAYPVALPVPRSTTIRALVPTGSHVGHGNALVHVRNSKGGGGRATKLERYTGSSTKKSSKDISPVAKKGFEGRSITAGLNRSIQNMAGSMPRGKERGLAMAHGYQPTGIPKSGRTAGKVQRLGRMKSAADERIGFGTDASRRNSDMTALRSKVNFGDAGRKGSRLA